MCQTEENIDMYIKMPILNIVKGLPKQYGLYTVVINIIVQMYNVHGDSQLLLCWYCDLNFTYVPLEIVDKKV